MSTEPLVEEIAHRLEAFEPATVLAVGPGAAALLAGWSSAGSAGTVETVALDGGAPRVLERLAELGRRDFAVVAGLVETQPREDAGRILARLRDVHVPRLCLVAPEVRASGVDSGWSAADLVAHGLTLLARDGAGALALYGFDIAAYKTTPDWLDSRNWANPALWDKHRW